MGLSDVYPYNREFPISVSLPSQVNWTDSTLTNTPLSTLFDNNSVAMRQNNIETTLEAPLHCNDFILPMNKDIRKVVTLLQGGSGEGASPSPTRTSGLPSPPRRPARCWDRTSSPPPPPSSSM